MTQYIDLLTLRVRSTGAIARGRFVTHAGGQVAAANAKALGVARHAAVGAGEEVAVITKGTAIVEAGGEIALGATVVSDSSGRAVAGAALAVATGATEVTSSAANGAILTGSNLPAHPMGDALQAATAAGQFIEILLR
jgi:hypothetical protein